MVTSNGDSIRVDVPVGQLLTAPEEITTTVTRPDGGPLSVKVRLIPASAAVGATPHSGNGSAPEAMMATTTYTGRTGRQPNGEGLDNDEYGGSA